MIYPSKKEDPLFSNQDPAFGKGTRAWAKPICFAAGRAAQAACEWPASCSSSHQPEPTVVRLSWPCAPGQRCSGQRRLSCCGQRSWTVVLLASSVLTKSSGGYFVQALGIYHESCCSSKGQARSSPDQPKPSKKAEEVLGGMSFPRPHGSTSLEALNPDFLHP